MLDNDEAMPIDPSTAHHSIATPQSPAEQPSPLTLNTTTETKVPESSSDDHDGKKVSGWEPGISFPRQTFLTFAASIASAGLTYPAEKWRCQWEGEALRQWNFDTVTAEPRSNRILTPFVRLWTNHAASNALHQHLWTSTSHNAPTTQLQHLEMQVLAGALAGVAQVALLLPLQMQKIYVQHYRELEEVQTWSHWWKSHFSGSPDGRGAWDPLEKHHRHLRSLGWVVGREIVFNISFFPVFNFLQQEELSWGSTYPVPGRPSLETLVTSGVGAGMLSALLVTPMDLLQVYFRHSREVWHWWRGLSVQAPPLPLLGRGLLLQACCFGPSFGLVAAMYELT